MLAYRARYNRFMLRYLLAFAVACACLLAQKPSFDIQALLKL